MKKKNSTSEGYRRAANSLRYDAKMYREMREDHLNRPRKESCSDAWLEVYNQIDIYCRSVAHKFDQMAETLESFGE